MSTTRGAEYDVQTSDKNTPLALACHGNYLSVIELLLPLNCNVNNQDKDMDSPLLYTTFNGNVKATHLLLEHGADPQMANNLGTTPIWNAIYAGNAELVHCFIECNVDLDGVSVGIDQHARQIDVSKIYSEPKSLLYVACDRLVANVPTWLVLAGLDLTRETWLYKDMLPRSLTVAESPEIKAICDELYHLTHNVRSLKQTCRVYIRRLLKRHLSRDVGKLGLPSLLQYYLSCKGFKNLV